MTAYVHPSAKVGDNFRPAPFVIIDDEVVIGDNVIVGPFTHIRRGARIGNDVMLGDHVTIHDEAEIGAETVIGDGSVLGKRPALSPRSTAKSGPLPGLVLGKRCRIGSNTVLTAGSSFGDGVIVGDAAGVRERCTIGDDVVVGRAVTVENDTAIGARTQIQSGAYVAANVSIEEDVVVAPMVVTTNDNDMARTEKRFAEIKGATIRRGARVGGGCHILPGVEIGEEAFIATGAVVTHDVPARTVVMGVPAKPVRRVPDEELPGAE